jgi:hypothetical protein
MPKIGKKHYGYDKKGMAAYKRDLLKKKAGKNGTANRRKVAR